MAVVVGVGELCSTSEAGIVACGQLVGVTFSDTPVVLIDVAVCNETCCIVLLKFCQMLLFVA